MFVGHEKQIEMFKRAIKSERLAHAYIFSGLRGIGKKLFAVNLAKSLLCERGSFFTECSCGSCTQINMGSHPDFYIYEEKSVSTDGKITNEDKVINIENVRKIIEMAGMTPLSGKWKTFILDSAHLLSDSAQGGPAANAILKTLEEPSDNTIFFLITNKYESVLPTIRSRTAHVKFSPLSISHIRQIISALMPEVQFIDRAAAISNGSVLKTIEILNEKFTDVTAFIRDKEFIKFAETVQKMKTTEELTTVISSVYPLALEEFKRTGKNSFCLLGYYLLDILKRFNYNANIDLVKADFASKVIEVFSEAA